MENRSTGNPTSIQAPHSRCPQCNSLQKKSTRNLVVCIDGTSNRFGQNNTNVLKLFNAIKLETTQPKQPEQYDDFINMETTQPEKPEQYAYYSSGIGTRLKSFNPLKRFQNAVADKLDRAFAWNKDKSIKDSYGWLARMYQEGDQIYLFGFSRGAYQVRVLAAMIQEVGLIRTPTEVQISTAYYHYEAARRGDEDAEQTARKFKNTFSWQDLRVHFVGVWDTVSSVGLLTEDVFLSASWSAAHACYFRHALALDERRVMFIPEYFCEMNSLKDGDTYAPTSTSRQSESTESANETIKEVWFAGDHSDVGGFNSPGRSHQAGSISLLWMRREAAENGLVLQPTDIIWDPNHLNFCVADSIEARWRLLEYLPIKHKVSFTGTGNYDRSLHGLQPRCIIPNQKLHASILYANEYEPLATPRGGLPIPISYTEPEDMKLDEQLWEMGVFDDTAAQDLLTRLDDPQRIAPIYLDRLLFMLRFKEGRQSVGNVPGWQHRFMNVINHAGSAPLVRFLALVAYYEASCGLVSPEPLQEVFDGAKKCLSAILAEHKHQDGPRVVALLRPLTKHQILRQHILTQDAWETLVGLLDKAAGQPGENFAQAMRGLSYMLQCEDTQQFFIDQLGANFPNSETPRISRILEVNDPPLLIAALRMVLTLARIPKVTAKSVCSVVKPRVRELTKRKGLVGLLAVEILLSLSSPNESDHLDVHHKQVQANLARALMNRLSPNKLDSGGGQGRDMDPELEQVLCRLFGIWDPPPEGSQSRRLKKVPRVAKVVQVVQNGNARERTAATMILLKLCEIETVRARLLRTQLLNVFVDQLKSKDKALLAAYALAICLKYDDMKRSIMDNKYLVKHIVRMLQLDYFDDAVGHTNGFQIFGDLMQQVELRKKLKGGVTEVLEKKLAKGETKEIRTSLICMDILRSFDNDGLVHELVNKSLDYLRDSEWKIQKGGVVILSVLAQREHGVAAIKPKIPEIIEMLLPRPNTDTVSVPPTPSQMMGPACALRNLAKNQTLRERTLATDQYRLLKDLYLSGRLVCDEDTEAWRVFTPNRIDVTNMLGKMIRAIEVGLSEEGLVSIGDTVLPHIRHWDRFLLMVCNWTVTVLAPLLALIGISAVVFIAMGKIALFVLGLKFGGMFVLVGLPVYVMVRVGMGVRRACSTVLRSRFLELLRQKFSRRS